MPDIELSPQAAAELLRLAREVGSAIEDRPEFRILWDERLVMGSTRRCHITSRGKGWLQRHGLA